MNCILFCPIDYQCGDSIKIVIFKKFILYEKNTYPVIGHGSTDQLRNGKNS